MKNLISLSLVFILASLNACGQKTDRLILGKKYAATELKEALSSTPGHNYIDNKRQIISDSATATEVVEPILFSIYGKDNIKKQRPYEIYHMDNYWVIIGTLPRDMLGGTFLIIMDARDAKIIKLTHGK